MAIPSFQEFKRLANQGNLIPLFEEIHFDWETPISAFRKIDDGPFSFLLESVEGGEKWGRYTFAGSNPSYIFRSKQKPKFEMANPSKGKLGTLSSLENRIQTCPAILFHLSSVERLSFV
jgi:anthranilate synthase component 1